MFSESRQVDSVKCELYAPQPKDGHSSDCIRKDGASGTSILSKTNHANSFESNNSIFGGNIQEASTLFKVKSCLSDVHVKIFFAFRVKRSVKVWTRPHGPKLGTNGSNYLESVVVDTLLQQFRIINDANPHKTAVGLIFGSADPSNLSTRHVWIAFPVHPVHPVQCTSGNWKEQQCE